MLIKRCYDDLDKYIESGKVLVIYGARQVGKTTLLKNYLSHTRLKYKLDSGDNITTQNVLGSKDFSKILEYAQGYELLAIDEAQQIRDVGYGLKIIVDQIADIKLVVTGSSSFELSQHLGEPLTGRKRTLTLYPISQKELSDRYNKHELKQRLEEFLVFGSYPEVVTANSRAKKMSLLVEISNSYLFKDILALERVKGAKILQDLIKLLAFQIGSEVSMNELATQLSIDVKTVGRYIELLEKAFVLTRLPAFSRNLRGEITSKCKFYFVDNGIRNAVVSQFNTLDNRDDAGALWENFIISERLKKRSYSDIYAQVYFWRTYSQKEIDLVEERDGKLYAYEIKWSARSKKACPADWKKSYPDSEFSVITPENYLDFVY